MAGISILLADFWLLIVFISSFIGFLFFIISIILFFKCKKSQEKGKISKKKIIAIVILIISIFFQAPLGITLFGINVVNKRDYEKKIEKLDAIENKIIVKEDKWEKGFDYDGKSLVPVNIFRNSYEFNSFSDEEMIGALVIKDSTNYYSLFKVKNDSGYDIYYVWLENFSGGDNYSTTFVDKGEYDDILDYYSKSANLSARAMWKTAPENLDIENIWKKLDLDINNYRGEIFELAKEVFDNNSTEKIVSFPNVKDYDNIEFKIKSEDGVFVIDLNIYTKDDDMILLLDGQMVEKNVVKQYKEIIFSIIRNSQNELLEKNKDL